MCRNKGNMHGEEKKGEEKDRFRKNDYRTGNWITCREKMWSSVTSNTCWLSSNSTAAPEDTVFIKKSKV